MAEILHKIAIAAPPTAVYAALTEQRGLAGWWTENVQAESKIGAVCRFRFNADTGPDMEIVGLDSAKRVHWRFVKHGPDPKHEWIGTELFFELEPESASTVLRFSHRYWPDGTDFIRYCSMKWATYLLGLKRLLETGEGTPYPRDVEIEPRLPKGIPQSVPIDPNILIIASATAKPGKEAELVAALHEVAEPTRAQPGCIRFGLYQLDDARATIVGIERWASAADHERHLAGAHFVRLAHRMADLVAEPPRIVTYGVINE